jgi:hypothetical protein
MLIQYLHRVSAAIFLALSLAWIGWSSWQIALADHQRASYSRETNTNENSRHAGSLDVGVGQKAANFQERDAAQKEQELTIQRDIARFNHQLVIATWVLGVVALVTGIILYFTLRATRIAADAAKNAANAAVNADRAHIHVIIKQHNVSDLIDSVSGAKYSLNIAKEPMNPPILSYVFKNYGKTPATIEAVMECMAIQRTEGEKRTYETRDRAIEILGEREESNPPLAVAFEASQFVGKDAKSLAEHQTMLFFYSGATFRDAFNRRHKIRHDFLYSAGRFHLISREEQSEESDRQSDQPSRTGFFHRLSKPWHSPQGGG